MSIEAKLVTLGALAFSAMTAMLAVDSGKARAVIATGGAIMTFGAAYEFFKTTQKKTS